MIRHLPLSPGRWIATWAAALFLLDNPVAQAQNSPQDAVAPSLVYLKVDFTRTKGPNSGNADSDQSTGFLVSEDGFILTSYELLKKVSEFGRRERQDHRRGRRSGSVSCNRCDR